MTAKVTRPLVWLAVAAVLAASCSQGGSAGRQDEQDQQDELTANPAGVNDTLYTPPVFDATTTSVPVSTTAPRPPKEIQAEDLVVQVDGRAPLAELPGQVQCDGDQFPASSRPEGFVGSGLADESSLRFGIEPDPVGSGPDSLVFRTDHNDAPYAGGQRCELAFLEAEFRLPKDEVFWQTMSLLVSDLDGSTDDQIIAQWHDGTTSGPDLAPLLAFYLSGRDLHILGRWDDGPEISNESAAVVSLHREPQFLSGQWHEFIIKAHLSTDPDEGILRVWSDGRLIVDYSGPIGYEQPESLDYAKLGFYHWYGENTWDDTVPVRTVMVREMSLINDLHKRYIFGDLDSYLQARLGEPN
ncbi:MAG: hypothetical protein GY745_12965 [Actinomycetia bacterium]|nr:hypothetical protein [Actinomycetes bacterium]